MKSEEQTPDFSEHLDVPEAPIDPNVFTKIGESCAALLKAESRVKELEQELKEAKSEKSKLNDKTIPDLCKEANNTTLWDNDSLALKLSESKKCSLPGPNAKTAEARLRGLEMLGWMRGNGHGAVIKTEVRIQFDSTAKNTEENIRFIQRMVRAMNGPDDGDQKPEIVDHSTVNAQTFNSWVNGCLKEGIELPPDLFKLHPTYKCKVTVK